MSNLQKKLYREIELNQIDHYRIINENAQLVKGINEVQNDLKATRLIQSGGGSGSEMSTTVPVSGGGGAPASASTSDVKEVVPHDTKIVDELKAQIQELQADVAMKMERIRYLENQMYKQETIKSLPNSKSELPPLDIGTWTHAAFWLHLKFVVEGMLRLCIGWYIYVNTTWRGCQMVVAIFVGLLGLI